MMIWALLTALFSGPAQAAIPAIPLLTFGQAHAEDGEAEAEDAEFLAEMEKVQAAQEAGAARVVVLEGAGSDLDNTDVRLIANIKTRIAREDAKFFPEIDLYQEGRKEPDESVRPLDQRATVAEATIYMLTEKADAVLATPVEAKSDQEWEDTALELRALLEEMWFIDRVELREPLFRLYAAIGYAADNFGAGRPPFYESVSDVGTAYYYYLAATMVVQTPDIAQAISSNDVRGSITWYADKIKAGAFDSLTFHFKLGLDKFDPEVFVTEYAVMVNGSPMTVTSADGSIELPPGRNDIYLKRREDESHSLSLRRDAVKTGQKAVVAVRDEAHHRMGQEFIEQLMKNPYECQPQVEGDILNYIAIYQTLHPGSDIYVAFPEDGNVNKIFLWRWKKDTGNLALVQDESGGFPVRFAATFGVGATFNGVSASLDPVDVPGQLPGVSPELTATGVPVDFQLRGHYSRLMFAFGVQWSYAIDGSWDDAYRVDDNQVFSSSTSASTAKTSGSTTTVNDQAQDAYLGQATKSRPFSPLVYGGLGIVFGNNAAIGFGPRLWVRSGRYAIPNMVDGSLHFGWSLQLGSKTSGRVRPLVDADLFGGALFPTASSLYQGAQPNFGLSAGVGTTF